MKATSYSTSSKLFLAQHALVATLGGKAQNFTFALDYLLDQGVPVQRVCALHLAPSDSRLARALNQLRQTFETHPRYQSLHLQLDSVAIRDNPSESLIALHSAAAGRAIQDVDDVAAPDAIWLTTHHLIRALQDAGYCVELCVAGGPRLISLQAISVASLLFRQRDRCWHLFTPRSVREQAGEGDILHVDKSAGVRLIEVPLLPMGMISPGLRTAASASPRDIIGAQRQSMDEQELARCRAVWRDLTVREREVLRAFAEGATSVKAAAEQIGVKPSTVDAHKTKIFALCRNIWGLGKGEPKHHSFLQQRFGTVIQGLSGLDP